MSKFKIGDKVKIVRKVESFDPGGMGPGRSWCNTWVHEMDKQVGRAVTIDGQDDELGYSMKETSRHWPEAALELVKNVPFKIEAGMRIRYRGSEALYAVLPTSLCWYKRNDPEVSDFPDLFAVSLAEDGGWMPISFKGRFNTAFDIVAVYDKPFHYANAIDAHTTPLVWGEKYYGLVVELAEAEKRVQELKAEIKEVEG